MNCMKDLKAHTKNKKRIFKAVPAILSSLLIPAALLCGCYAYDFDPEAEYRLPVFETSDIHGALMGGEEPDYEYRVAYFADKVEDVRKGDPKKAVLLDGGDVFQGGPVSLLTQGEVMSAVFDKMQYDAIAVGNHEFDWYIDNVIDQDGTMCDYSKDGIPAINSIPFLCMNLYKDGEKAQFAKDYVILNKTASDAYGREKEVRVAVIGFAEDYSFSTAANRFKDLGYSIVTDYEEVNRLAAKLENNDECDATILLAHGDAGTIAEGLGNKSPVDLVLGGHVHKNINDKTDWGLTYLSPAGNAYACAYSELVFENNGRNGVRLKTDTDEKSDLLKIPEDEVLFDTAENAEELDRGVIDLTNEYFDRVRPELEQEIGYVTEPVTRDRLEESGKRVSTASNFICNALIRAADVDIVFVNKALVRGDLEIANGNDRHIVTMMDIFSMLPFDSSLYCYEITYEDLLDILNFSLNGSGYSLLTCMSGIDCYYKDDPADDKSKEYADTIVDALVMDGKLIYHDGNWREDIKDKTVKIAVNDLAVESAYTKDGTANPLYGYIYTDRLISDDGILRDLVIEGLRSEAAENDGHLSTDTDPHYIYWQ